MPNISIETDRLLLREMSLSDMEALSSILQDENVMYAYNGAFSDEETLAWMQKQLRRYREHGFGLWGIFQKSTGEMIGATCNQHSIPAPYLYGTDRATED